MPITLSPWRAGVDARAQRLTEISDTPFDGIVPEGVDFDPSGRRFAVATYQRD